MTCRMFYMGSHITQDIHARDDNGRTATPLLSSVRDKLRDFITVRGYRVRTRTKASSSQPRVLVVVSTSLVGW